MARKIPVRCPACRARLKGPEKLIGQTRDCPRCGVPFVVSEAGRASEKTALKLEQQVETILISQRDTIDQRLEWGEIKSGQPSASEKLDAEGARVLDLVTEFVRKVGKPGAPKQG